MRATVGDVLVDPLIDRAHRLEKILGQIPADEPDSVHQLRVTGRRLNLVLWVLGKSPVGHSARGAELAPLRDDVRWLTTVAARVRDLEVIAAQLDNVAAAVALAERSEEVHRLQVVLNNSPADRIPSRLTEFAHALESHDLAKPAHKITRKVLRSCDRRMRVALLGLEGAPPADAALHAVRKTMRRARYAAELAAPALGQEVADYAAALESCQQNLGAHQDASVALSWLRSRRTELVVDPDLVERLMQAQQRARGLFAVTEVPTFPREPH